MQDVAWYRTWILTRGKNVVEGIDPKADSKRLIAEATWELVVEPEAAACNQKKELQSLEAAMLRTPHPLHGLRVSYVKPWTKFQPLVATSLKSGSVEEE
jgi:hypothetical protein